MHQKIMAFPSFYFYENLLIADDSVSQRLLSDIPGVDDTEDTSIPMLWIDTAGCGWLEQVEEDACGQPGNSLFNPGEATQVIRHIRGLIASGLPVKSIAVITPYKGQVAYLRNKLCNTYPLLEIGSGKLFLLYIFFYNRLTLQ
jgi:superfamily I DNA and/or RNA helicase